MSRIVRSPHEGCRRQGVARSRDRSGWEGRVTRWRTRVLRKDSSLSQRPPPVTGLPLRCPARRRTRRRCIRAAPPRGSRALPRPLLSHAAIHRESCVSARVMFHRRPWLPDHYAPNAGQTALRGWARWRQLDRRCSQRYTDGGCVVSSRYSQPFANAHSRFTVAGEMPSAAAVSSTVRPAKNRSSTMRPCVGSSCSSF